MDAAIQARVNVWTNGNYDQATKDAISDLQSNNVDELADSFYRNLEFGTGGLRGIMGVGTNRINKYTIGMATQGFANYLKKTYGDAEIKVAIAHDSRNNSRFFAETTANVFAANGIKVFLFEALRPTPELSFAIRHLGCSGGVVCTASHNPKEYNGYKAYWNDGGQLVPPHDKNVIKEVEAVSGIDEVKWSGGEANISILGKDMDNAYIQMVKGLSVYPDVIARQKDLKIVYTPIHGTGITLVPEVLKAFGFTNVTIVEEQATPDGNFPTVAYPNPEESATMGIGLKLAKELDADILLGTDPDADRVAIGVKNHHGEWVLMNGNQTAVLACNYMMEARKAKGIAQPNDMVITTIVTTQMVNDLAAGYGVACYNVLTGFKWIAELIKAKAGQENYIIGGEESFGLMIGDQVRDKDAISAVALMCEMAAYAKDQGLTLFDKMIELYQQYGFYYETLISITKKGMNGQKEIADMMNGYRNNPPATIDGSKVVQLLDYELQKGTNPSTGETWPIHLPKSNVLQFITEDGSKISARPSGTEPKIKFYFSVKTSLANKAVFDSTFAQLETKIARIIVDMQLS
ncbi:MAG: phosphoglucomutase [Bacteroidetes bacterium 24-39-8]|jgi:phosphoglucomutase|nr:MAG: phosphoglucomutase [Sphingobacteriia bacterium 35-40-8]OYZ48055.1 MAG: phosphoglucomutase [Bacteroidetes bacterium 24-39-8]OZA63915.1 MAG: phosphoglucomutase [Sphingobacteriia bacterium 39-39-8]HQR93260.1 phospho-sugar mutase [Sediminibacterium sp.]HQS56007.1 phospho-sugar mutase [Sediminibacterium sp.]